MKAFYGSRFSKNMTITPEGFLICHNVPLARTGWYEYLGTEVGLDTEDIVKVYRSPDEVFSKEAIASFEGKPVTDNHPPELLTSKDTIYIKGTAQNIRRSTEEPDLLVGDLFIYDEILIREIQEGKREVSCGYDLFYQNNGDGTYSQVQIRGNHVAIVNSGRAGSRVAIKDSNSNMKGEKRMGKKIKMPQNNAVTSILTALGLKHYAADAEPDEIANTLDQLAEERHQEKNVEDNEIQEKTKEKQQDSESIQNNNQIESVVEEVSKLTQAVNQLIACQQKNNDEKTPEQEIDEAIKELSAAESDITDEENSVTIPVEGLDETIPDGVVATPEQRPQSGMDSFAKMMALQAIKPIIANIKDKNEKKKACDAALAVFRSTNKTKNHINGYSSILKNQKNNANKMQQAADATAKKMESLGEEYKKQFNPHYKGGK